RCWGLLLLALIAAAAGLAQRPVGRDMSNKLAPFVTSPLSVVEKMLEAAELKSGEVVYDLGSGDGRVLITAAQKYAVRGVGIEISEPLVRATNERLRRLNLANRVKIINEDLMKVDLSPADVVIIYLETKSNELLRPNLEKYLRSGARVVSHDFAVKGWKPARVERIEAFNRPHTIYVYEMPQRAN
ncbi:MAG TPA: class I SAM-dependent methyltransferase, partial [Bryobacteraceae bacterium]|nr:class I SAM-dependent methyltransferase [Bryobacteraceae bacterium]